MAYRVRQVRAASLAYLKVRKEMAPSAARMAAWTALKRDDPDILESTDPDALFDTRRRGIEYSMDSDRTGVPIRGRPMERLAAHGTAAVNR
jgi:hypothetical protein